MGEIKFTKAKQSRFVYSWVCVVHYLLIVILSKSRFKDGGNARCKIDIWLRGIAIICIVGGKSRGWECWEARGGKVTVKDMFDRRSAKLRFVSERLVQPQLGKCPFFKCRVVHRWRRGCARPRSNDDIATPPAVFRCGGS